MINKKNHKSRMVLPNLVLISFLFMLVGCDTFLDDEKYTGPPHDLRYTEIGTYPIGENYVSIQPTVMGGAGATFSIVNIEGPESVSEENLTASFDVDASNGYINIKEYCRLDSGFYSLDVKVENAYGSAMFENTFQFPAIQIVPSELRYIPSVYSFYGNNSTGESTELPLVKGGGPFTFAMDDPIGTFEINEATGAIVKIDEFDLGPDDKIIKVFDVSVSNKKGTFLAEDVVTLELLGENVGKLTYNAEYNDATAISDGIINADTYTYAGPVTEVLDGEEYTTELTGSSNGLIWKGDRRLNSWHSWESKMTFDVSGGGVAKNVKFLSFKTGGIKVECVAIVVTDGIDLANASTEAYTEIVGWKKYINADINQQFELLVCEESQYDAEKPFEVEWTTIHENIAPGLIQASKAPNESDLYENGTQIISIPSGFLGKKVRLALKAKHLNPDLGNLGREPYIYKWQVRYVQ